MKSKVMCACILGFLSVNANSASSVDSLIIYSKQRDKSSVWTSVKSTHLKTFDASIFNGGKKDINLGTLCYKAYDAKGNVYKLDAIDEKITQGLLMPGQSITGFYTFESEGEGVYTASIIKASIDCK